MKTYFIYILKCSDNLLYTGFTNNIERRFNEWSSKKKLALANNNFDMLEILSECRNATHHKYNPEK